MSEAMNEDGGRRGTGGRAHRKLAMRGPMTIYEAASDKKRLLDALEGARELEIDLSRVSDMDTAGIQVLLLLKREAISRGKALRLSAHNAVVLDVLNAYNLGAYFGDPVVMPSRRRHPAQRGQG